MYGQIIILLVAALGYGLACNPITNKINPRLVKAATWCFRAIVLRLLK